MTEQKTFKRRVRARMEKTGESYTAARRMLLAPDFEPPVSEARLIGETGRDYLRWFGLMDAAGLEARSHGDMVRWLMAEQELGNWWAQTVALAYERARGLRAPGQRADGFMISASKTVIAPVEELFRAFAEAAPPELRLRTATAPRSARYDWEDGATRVNVGFEARLGGKARVALAHERLPDAAAAEAMKAYWRERLAALATVLAQRR
jgi:hypothetical protein